MTLHIEEGFFTDYLYDDGERVGKWIRGDKVKLYDVNTPEFKKNLIEKWIKNRGYLFKGFDGGRTTKPL